MIQHDKTFVEKLMKSSNNCMRKPLTVIGFTTAANFTTFDIVKHRRAVHFTGYFFALEIYRHTFQNFL